MNGIDKSASELLQQNAFSEIPMTVDGQFQTAAHQQIPQEFDQKTQARRLGTILAVDGAESTPSPESAGSGDSAVGPMEQADHSNTYETSTLGEQMDSGHDSALAQPINSSHHFSAENSTPAEAELQSPTLAPVSQEKKRHRRGKREAAYLNRFAESLEIPVPLSGEERYTSSGRLVRSRDPSQPQPQTKPPSNFHSLPTRTATRQQQPPPKRLASFSPGKTREDEHVPHEGHAPNTEEGHVESLFALAEIAWFDQPSPSPSHPPIKTVSIQSDPKSDPAAHDTQPETVPDDPSSFDSEEHSSFPAMPPLRPPSPSTNFETPSTDPWSNFTTSMLTVWEPRSQSWISLATGHRVPFPSDRNRVLDPTQLSCFSALHQVDGRMILSQNSDDEQIFVPRVPPPMPPPPPSIPRLPPPSPPLAPEPKPQRKRRARAARAGQTSKRSFAPLFPSLSSLPFSDYSLPDSIWNETEDGGFDLCLPYFNPPPPPPPPSRASRQRQAKKKRSDGYIETRWGFQSSSESSPEDHLSDEDWGRMEYAQPQQPSRPTRTSRSNVQAAPVVHQSTAYDSYYYYDSNATNNMFDQQMQMENGENIGDLYVDLSSQYAGGGDSGVGVGVGENFEGYLMPPEIPLLWEDEYPPNYEHAHQNIYLNPQQKRAYGGNDSFESDGIQTCNCYFRMDEPPCGRSCVNRGTNNECVPGYCAMGDFCTNQQMQRFQYKKLVVKRSGAKGYGLFAEEDIKAGEFVIEYVGEVIGNAERDARLRMASDLGESHFYFLALDNELTIDASRKGNAARFINHSCDPNCETQKWTVGSENRIGIFARRDIKKGEETNFDYDFERTGTEKQRCHCGSRDCRQFIGPKKERRPFSRGYVISTRSQARRSASSPPELTASSTASHTAAATAAATTSNRRSATTKSHQPPPPPSRPVLNRIDSALTYIEQFKLTSKKRNVLRDKFGGNPMFLWRSLKKGYLGRRSMAWQMHEEFDDIFGKDQSDPDTSEHATQSFPPLPSSSEAQPMQQQVAPQPQARTKRAKVRVRPEEPAYPEYPPQQQQEMWGEQQQMMTEEQMQYYAYQEGDSMAQYQADSFGAYQGEFSYYNDGTLFYDESATGFMPTTDGQTWGQQ